MFGMLPVNFSTTFTLFASLTEILSIFFKRLAEIADSKTLTKEEQEKYDNSMMVMWDNYAVFKHAVEKEAKKKSKEIALKLLARNTPLDDIADLTDLSIEEIKKLEQ